MMDLTSTYSQSTLSFADPQIAHHLPLLQQEHCYLEHLYAYIRA